MSFDENILIERFFRDKLSKNERNEFFKKIEKNVDFREKFLLEKQLFESLNEKDWSYVNNVDTRMIAENKELFVDDESIRLKQMLREIGTQYKLEKKAKNKKLSYVIGVAATIVLLITLNTFNFTNQNLGQKYYEQYIMLEDLPSFTKRGVVEDEAKNLMLAEGYFKKGNYGDALISLGNISNIELKNGNFYVYKAISQIELMQYEEATKTLDVLINSNLIDSPKGYWYKSLLYIRSNEFSKAKNELKNLRSKSEYKRKEVEELLKELE
jgi:hypothetical protein